MKTPIRSILMTILLITSAAAPLGASAGALDPGTRWTTDYLSREGIYILEIGKDGKTFFSEDHNNCMLSSLGEPEMCTKMMALAQPAQLVPAQVAANRRSSVYDIQVEDKNASFRLVITLMGSDLDPQVKLIKLDADGYAQEAFRMHRVYR